MDKLIIFLLLFLPLTKISFSQCVSGDCQNGTGIFLYKSGSKFVGTWQNGKRVKGTFYYASGDKYIGEFTNNKRHGKGTFQYKSGNKFEGTWENGDKKYGAFYYVNGSKYKGNYQNDERNGKGTLYLADGTILAGQWNNGKFIGYDNANTAPKIYAVIVGVSNYKYINSLNYCDDDARLFYQFLKSPQGGSLPENQIAVLLDNQATKTNIVNTLNKTFSKATKNDFVIFYFSGHGTEGAFCPTDCNSYGANILDHKEVKAAFKSCSAKYKLCLADACHSGSIRQKSSKSTNEKSSPNYYSAFQSDKRSIVVMVSSKTEETSIEFGGLRQGVFSYYLIDGLKGKADKDNDKIIYVDELYLHIEKNVKDYTRSKQNPVIFGENIKAMPVGIVR